MQENNATVASAASNEDIIAVQDLNKWYGEFHVLKSINLNVRKGERIVICGPSGSGKSTFIRCINHLEAHQRGNIVVDGVELNEDIKNIEAIRREVGMVFQHFNLFPHLSVSRTACSPPSGCARPHVTRPLKRPCSTLSA